MVRTAADRSRLPDGVPAAVADFDNAASLAVRAGVRHLVVLSQLAAEEQSPCGSCAITSVRGNLSSSSGEFLMVLGTSL